MNRNINELQYLRAFAIIVVMTHHMDHNLFTWESVARQTFYTYFSARAALDMFFALSGFVIARLLFHDLANTENRFHDMQVSCIFWVRRAWRLLPAAWLWLVITLALTIFFNQSGVFGAVRDAWSGVLTAFLQVANLKFGDCFLHYSCGPTFAYWSLSLEEQFYIFLPILLIFARKWFLHVILILAFTQMFVLPLLLPDHMRLQGFLLGVLLAIWSKSPTYRIFEPTILGRSKVLRWGVLGFLLTCICAMNANIIPQFMLLQLSALIGTALVFIASFNNGYLWKVDGALKAFGLWLGSRTYTMYLCHIPMYLLTREVAWRILGPEQPLGPQHFWYLLVAGVGATVVCSELTYSFLEKPLRIRGIRLSNEMKKRQQAERSATADNKLPLID